MHEDGPTRLSPGALEGRTVLVTGGAGAVGHAAIQLARWAGAEVITTISSDAKARLASAAGAHHVVTYTDGDPAAARALLEQVAVRVLDGHARSPSPRGGRAACAPRER